MAALVLAIALSSGEGLAASTWQAHESEAVAILPDPSEGEAVTGGTMACAEQKWSLTLTGAPLSGDTPLVPGAARLVVDASSYPVTAEIEADAIRIALPRETIEPLMAGLRLAVAFGEDEPVVTFSLRGSRRAIGAAAERCSPRVLPSRNRVRFTVYSSYLPLARALRADDIDAFRNATSSQPELAAGMLELDGGKRVFFTELCGSSWYFGVSGCNVSAFVPDDARESGWRLVLDMEGAAVYADPAVTTGGWPDLRALPIKSHGDGVTWRWDGTRYAAVATPEK